MKYWSLLFALLVIVSCSNQPQSKPFDPATDHKLIQSQMSEQEKSWNEANLEGFMKHYWQSDSLKFIGSRGVTYGWQKTLDNYRSGYPDAAAMGRLQFTNLTVDVLDSTNAYVIGRWELFRTADTLSGHYTLLWKKLGGKWVIVADHSS